MLRIGIDNYITNATVTATSTNPSFPVSNSQTAMLTRWQSISPITTYTATFTERTVDMICLFNTNFETVDVRGYLSDVVVFETYKLRSDFDGIDIENIYINCGYTLDKIEFTFNVPVIEKITNGNFAAGSTGWAIGAGASVRQQGWYLRGENGDYYQTPTIASATVGDVFELHYAMNVDDYVGTSVGIRLRGIDAVGATKEFDLDTLTVTNGYALGVLSLTITDALVVNVNIDFLNNGFVSGNWKAGYLYLTKNGIVVYENWDFADGDIDWATDPANQFITYDPASAYMGNAMPGGSGNTLVLRGNGATYSAESNRSAIQPGQTVFATYNAKQLVNAGDLQINVVFRLDGVYVSQEAVSIDNVADWAEFTITATAPDGCNQVSWSARVTPDDGLWLVGEVSVKEMPVITSTSTPYIGYTFIGTTNEHDFEAVQSTDESTEDVAITKGGVAETNPGYVYRTWQLTLAKQNYTYAQLRALMRSIITEWSTPRPFVITGDCIPTDVALGILDSGKVQYDILDVNINGQRTANATIGIREVIAGRNR